MTIRAGLIGDIEIVVSEDMTAARYGNDGVEVLATPYLIGLLESASVLAIHSELLEGQSSVGTRVDVRHEAATPVGMPVRVRSTLVEIDGRRLTFQVEAHDERDRIMSGMHERYLIDLARFLNKVNNKSAAS